MSDQSFTNRFLRGHATLERSPTMLLSLSLFVVTIGGLVEITPLFYLENTIGDVKGVRHYSPLELAGRDVYIHEGCYVCHSQMIRPPPLSGIFEVPVSGSVIAWEPGISLRQEVSPKGVTGAKPDRAETSNIAALAGFAGTVERTVIAIQIRSGLNSF